MEVSTIITTENLTKCYGKKIAVDNLNLTLNKGEVFGLLGPNGAGKTTTILMLLGLTSPTSGAAFIDTFNCTRNPIEVKRIVGYLPDNVGFYGDMTGRENLRFTAQLNDISYSETESRIEMLLKQVGMIDVADQKTSTYSRGMKQRLGIADALVKDPAVVILDEPTLGIDPEGVRELTALIRELADKDGRTVLISSHQLYQVQKVCDRVGIFVNGKLSACGTIDELGSALESDDKHIIALEVEPFTEGLKAEIENIEYVTSVSVKENKAEIHSSKDIIKQLSTVLENNHCTILELKRQSGDLDEIYRRYFEKEAVT